MKSFYSTLIRVFLPRFHCTLAHGVKSAVMVEPGTSEHMARIYCTQCQWVTGEWLRRPISDFPLAVPLGGQATRKHLLQLVDWQRRHPRA